MRITDFEETVDLENEKVRRMPLAEAGPGHLHT